MILYIFFLLTILLTISVSFLWYKIKDIVYYNTIEEIEYLITDITEQTDKLKENIEILDLSVASLGEEISQLKLRNEVLSTQLIEIHNFLDQINPKTT